MLTQDFSPILIQYIDMDSPGCQAGPESLFPRAHFPSSVAVETLGKVQSAANIKGESSGESRGFGFVEMPNKEEADKAISELNGKDLKGRPLTVNRAGPRTDRPLAGGSDRSSARPRPDRLNNMSLTSARGGDTLFVEMGSKEIPINERRRDPA